MDTLTNWTTGNPCSGWRRNQDKPLPEIASVYRTCIAYTMQSLLIIMCKLTADSWLHTWCHSVHRHVCILTSSGNLWMMSSIFSGSPVSYTCKWRSVFWLLRLPYQCMCEHALQLLLCSPFCKRRKVVLSLQSGLALNLSSEGLPQPVIPTHSELSSCKLCLLPFTNITTFLYYY